MIAADSSSIVAYLAGENGPDVDALDDCLARGDLVLPAVVVTELLSHPRLAPSLSAAFREIPRLDPTEGFWERAGLLRARVVARGMRARLADSLISQLCIDHEVPIVTRDFDFRHFVAEGLGLAVPPGALRR